MKIADVMNKTPSTIFNTAKLAEAARLVSKSQVSDLMVIDKAGQFQGVLSEGDIIRAALPDYDDLMHNDTPLNQAWKIFIEKAKILASRSISPLVIQQPIFFAPENELLKAAATMINKQIRILPVVEGGQLVGTISRGDLAAALMSK